MQDWEWIFIDAQTAGFWRLGQAVNAGDLLGETVTGRPIRSSVTGTVAGIQFDVDRGELILAVQPYSIGLHKFAS